MRDSNLRGTGHAVNFPKEWLPQKPPPTPPPAAPPAEVEDSDPYAAAKITGKSTMNAAKRKNYEKMLEAIVMEEQSMRKQRAHAAGLTIGPTDVLSSTFNKKMLQA